MSAVEATGTPQGSSAGRVPPNELDAEAAVLSAVLLDADAQFDRVQETPAPEHLYADANRRIYEAVLDLEEHVRAAGGRSVGGGSRLRRSQSARADRWHAVTWRSSRDATLR